MRLRRIEAVRFGRLENVTLGALGDGLTVVLGPNGAGKTSFTTLVRHVLYGYPTKRSSEKTYEAAAGKRLARLEYESPEGSWVVQRTEGVHGGPVEVAPVAGAARPDLAAAITRGVSANEFRVVFGFGLDDMPDIEPGRGSGDVLSRFYAAQVGLSVSPQDVRADLEAAAATLYKPRGSTPEANAALAEVKSIKRRIRELEDAAARFAEERSRLTELKARAEATRAERETAVLSRSELEAILRSLESAEERLGVMDEAIRARRAEVARFSERRAGLSIDDALLSASPELGALLDDVSGFRERLALAERAGARALDLTATAARVLESAGIEPSSATSLDGGPEVRTMAERYRDQLARSEDNAAAARDKLGVAEDRVGASVATAGSLQTSVAPPPPVAAIVMIALGVIAALLGIVLREWVSLGVGAAVIAVGGVLLIGGSRGLKPGAAPSDIDVSARNMLELARLEAERADTGLAELRAEWASWSEERGLQVLGTTPQAVLLGLASLEEWRAAVSGAAAARLEADEHHAWCEAFRARLAAVAGPHGVSLAAVTLSDLPTHAARIRELLESARTAAVERKQLDERAAEAQADLERLESERAHIVAARDAALERVGDPDADIVLVRARTEAAAAAVDEVDARLLELTAHVSRLEGELNNEGRDTELAELRLSLSGLHERLSSAVERYSVYTLAAGLLTRTQAFHEEARQPEVVRRAGEVFRDITGGLYERIAIPLGGDEIVAFRGGDAVPTSELSKGGQEQLYLALRIALVEQLDEVGEGLPVLMDDIFANFDPDAHRGAVAAVTELARHRQVVFFTCHPEVADSFASVDPDATRLTLERC